MTSTSSPLPPPPPVPSSSEQLKQLNEIAKVVAADPNLYPQVLPGILGIATGEDVNLRLWAANFINNAFITEAMAIETRQQWAVNALDTFLILITTNNYTVIKAVISGACNIYPLVFAYISEHQEEETVWTKLIQLKSSVLRHWNDSHFGVEACCIKFAQQVISCQSFPTRDPRLLDRNDVSMGIVPPGHPLIGSTLEAESQGLLDRLLQVFSEPSFFAPKVTATIFALSPLVRSRPPLVPSIMKSLLSFDSSRKSTFGGSDTRIELEYKSVDKAVRLLLDSVRKSNVAPKFNAQIHRYINTIAQGRASEKLKKRMAQSETDSDNKRIKLETPATVPINSSTIMPAGPASYASLFTLISENDPLLSFNAGDLSAEIATSIALAAIAAAQPELLANCISIIQARYKNLLEQAPSSISPQSSQYPLDSMYDNDDSDYEPVDSTIPDTEDAGPDGPEVPSSDEDEYEAIAGGSSFTLPPPPVLSQQEKLSHFTEIIHRFMSPMSLADTTVQSLRREAAQANKGINRVAVIDWDSNTWVTILSRLLTRGLRPSIKEDSNDTSKKDLLSGSFASQASDLIRENLFKYSMSNFRQRLEVIITWLNEEWFSELLEKKKKEESNGTEAIENIAENGDNSSSIYYKWTCEVLDNMIPFLEVSDSKVFIRLLSDLPELDKGIISRLKSLSGDPERSQIGFRALKFLIMFRPPVKSICLDLVQDLYDNNLDSRSSARPILKRYRPEFLAEREQRELAEQDSKNDLTNEIKQDPSAEPSSEPSGPSSTSENHIKSELVDPQIKTDL